MWISCVILVLAAAGYALWPLFVKTDDVPSAAPAETDADYLTARKTALYRNIKELEFEYKMGRLTQAGFRQLEKEYKCEAADILQKLDMLNALAIDASAAKARVIINDDDKTGACPACGSKTIPGKKFCADCGARLQ